MNLRNFEHRPFTSENRRRFGLGQISATPGGPYVFGEEEHEHALNVRKIITDCDLNAKY